MMAPDGKATTQTKTFSRETAVTIEIRSANSIIWKLLTNAADYPRWNTTIISVNGNINTGEKIKLKSVLAPARVFQLTVKEMIPEKRLIWGDGMGTRTYSLEDKGNGRTVFSMHEKIGGPLFPMFARHIPPFNESFERFAADLKKEAELIQTSEK